jgi:hypothetical protein
MDIFESLENLNVSEECFNDIINIVEDLLNEEDSLDDGSHIRKRYGKPEYKGIDSKGFEIPANKSAKLYAKAHSKDNKYPYTPAHNEGKGVGEYGKRVSQGESDRKAWVKTDTPKEIQEPLSVAKSQEKGARKLLDKNEFKNKRDQIKAKRLLQGALINKSSQLHKKADNLNKAAEFDPDDYDNFEDNTDAATELEAQAQQRKEAAQKASKEARHIHNELDNPEKPEKKVERVHKK